jgi:hypothetical protein
VGCIEGRTAIEYFTPVSGGRHPPPPGPEIYRKQIAIFQILCSVAIGSLPPPCPVTPTSRERNPDTKGENISSVNAIAFSPQNTFLTAGSDGVMAYWDKNSRSTLLLTHSALSPVPFCHWTTQVPTEGPRCLPAKISDHSRHSFSQSTLPALPAPALTTLLPAG